MEVKFTVYGPPKGKGRPRFSIRKSGNGKAFAGARTPDETVLYENQIKMEYRQSNGQLRFPDDAQLVLIVKAYYEIPKNVSKKRREKMLLCDIRPTKKPDWDNIGKVASDALNGIAYRDDAQIVEAIVGKYYSETPRLEVTIKEAHEED